ncbi:hypothetical protein ACNR9V_10140 [Parageobacillus thermoglucosidasius]|uniref:hypothetical protein n=1 Tax=Parageobacillus thermoglucosidasius TaxID=1426 RepID=UPI003B67958B
MNVETRKFIADFIKALETEIQHIKNKDGNMKINNKAIPKLHSILGDEIQNGSGSDSCDLAFMVTSAIIHAEQR